MKQQKFQFHVTNEGMYWTKKKQFSRKNSNQINWCFVLNAKCLAVQCTILVGEFEWIINESIIIITPMYIYVYNIVLSNGIIFLTWWQLHTHTHTERINKNGGGTHFSVDKERKNRYSEHKKCGWICTQAAQKVVRERDKNDGWTNCFCKLDTDTDITIYIKLETMLL